MTIQECYEAIGGDYTGVSARLAKDERILKYLRKFAAGKDYELLENDLAEGRYEDAFRDVHNIKGVCANLGITALWKSSDVLCEELRGGKPQQDITAMVQDVKNKYDETVAAILKIEA